MRCKYDRVLSIVREQLHREPDQGYVFIMMSKNRRLVRMFMYDKVGSMLFEKKLFGVLNTLPRRITIFY